MDNLIKDEWDLNILQLLDKIRLNSANLSEYHRKRFYHYKSFSKYFDLPILVLSSISASFSVGSQSYLEQHIISLITCVIGLFISIITSIKLYLNIEASMMNELTVSKQFYVLSVDIYKTTSLKACDRGVDAVNFVDKCYSRYVKLVENSNLLKKRFKHDKLVDLDEKELIEISSDGSITPKKISHCNIAIQSDECFDIDTDIQQSEV